MLPASKVWNKYFVDMDDGYDPQNEGMIHYSTWLTSFIDVYIINRYKKWKVIEMKVNGVWSWQKITLNLDWLKRRKNSFTKQNDCIRRNELKVCYQFVKYQYVMICWGKGVVSVILLHYKSAGRIVLVVLFIPESPFERSDTFKTIGPVGWTCG